MCLPCAERLQLFTEDIDGARKVTFFRARMTDVLAKFVAYTGKRLPDDVRAKIRELAAQEDAPLAKSIYETMEKNQELAVKLNRPSCQDTGAAQFFLKCGRTSRTWLRWRGSCTRRSCRRRQRHRCAVVAAECVEEIVDENWLDLGMPETLWTCKVKEFGPLIVSIDSHGRNIFEENKVIFNERKEKACAEICKQVGFIK